MGHLKRCFAAWLYESSKANISIFIATFVEPNVNGSWAMLTCLKELKKELLKSPLILRRGCNDESSLQFAVQGMISWGTRLWEHEILVDRGSDLSAFSWCA